MKKIIIFSGTTEGRKLSELLADANIPHGVSVASNYGELVMEKHPMVTIYKGRLSERKMKEFLRTYEAQIVVDATHPYATEVTRTIQSCVQSLQKEKLDVTYLRLERENSSINNEDLKSGNLHFFKDNESCCKALKNIQGNILLTTGSKELHIYCQSEEIRKRLYVRVLPGMESLTICREQGLLPQQVLALQGPFTVELNTAFIHQYHISCMVTKQGGINGGFPEKQRAAFQTGISLLVIQKEAEKCSYSFQEILQQLEQLLGVAIRSHKQAELIITLAGIGMGSIGSMTVEVEHLISMADLIIGANRVIEPFTAKLEKKAAYVPLEILNWLQTKSNQFAMCGTLQVVILFSGDSGFWSGCQSVREILDSAIQQRVIQGTIRTCPGISSIQAMAAACSISWQNAGIYSIHGRTNQKGWEEDLLYQIQLNETLFLLVSGANDVRTLGKLLIEYQQQCLSNGYRRNENQLKENYDIYVGYQLSYPEEKVSCLTPKQCLEVKKEGLYILIISHRIHNQKNDMDAINNHMIQQENTRLEAYKPIIEQNPITPSLSDSEFLRGKVPMTKEEIRQLSICKLKLHSDSILYDVGSGTGSIAIEAARLSNHIMVYAIEQKNEAVQLLFQNKEKFKVENMKIVNGKAPEVLSSLEVPTHAFIGGTSGHLISILQTLYRLNPTIRIVVNAISLETISELKQIPTLFPLKEFQMVQVQVNHYRTLSSYHLPKAENPVIICSFEFDGFGTRKEDI